MKYILWYAVPLMGHESEHYDHFKDMILRDEPGLLAGVLDPRYKEVREFLAGIYVKALQAWNLDGFKLDFVDTWCDVPGNAPYNEKMDIPALQDAVEKLLADGTLAESPIVHRVAAVSVGVCDGRPTLDLDYAHDSTAEVDLNVVMTDDGRYVELQGTAEHKPFTEESLDALRSLARKGIRRIFSLMG